MSDDKEKDYFVPEQLDDDDFEKEKKEAKINKKEKKLKKMQSAISDDEGNQPKQMNKKKTVKIAAIIVLIGLIIFAAIWYVTPHEKKASAPEQAAKDFCAYFNSGNWKKVNDFMDLKGYYILGYVLKESEYTKFDTAYQNFKEDETYTQYTDAMNVLTSIDNETLNSFVNIQIKIKSIEACNKIQGTDSLYKLRVNFDYIYDGQSENLTGVIFVSNVSGQYKMVYGEWMQTILNYYQSVYMFQYNYNH